MLKIQKLIRKYYFRRKAPIFQLFNEWMSDQSLPLEQLKEKQLKLLNRLLTHAYNNVAYYNKLLENSPYKKDNRIALSSLDDLQQLPFLTKDIIKENQFNLHSSDHSQRNSYINSSGGSTGVPMEVLQDEGYLIANESCLLQLKNWRGVDPFDSEIFIWGAERDTFEGKKPLSSYIGDFMRNRIILNCFRMDNADIERYIKIINKHKPKMIRAYVDAVYEIARYARENKINISPQNLVHTGAGNLFDYMRTEIENAFGCKVFNQYGGREVGHIASECSAHDGLHIFMEHNYVEIVDDNGKPCNPGDEGEIVVTNLNNFSMPMIRYKIGDTGIMRKYTPCSCGCNYPKLTEVSGRVGDVFVTEDGRSISPVYFAHLIGVVCNDGSISKYQIIQKDYDKIIIKIVKNGVVSETVLDDIRNKIKDNMGGECTVEYQFVDDIEKTPTGKYRYTISEVKR